MRGTEERMSSPLAGMSRRCVVLCTKRGKEERMSSSWAGVSRRGVQRDVQKKECPHPG